MIDPTTLPDNLPAPADHGACEHLPGRVVEPLIGEAPQRRFHLH